MIKKILLLFICLLILSSITNAAELRMPQGRMGLSYKPERYSPYFKTNLTKAELEKISSILKKEKDTEKQTKIEQKEESIKSKKIAKTNYQKEKQEIKEKQLAQKLQEKKELEIEKQRQKNKLAQEKQYAKEQKFKKAQEKKLAKAKKQEEEKIKKQLLKEEKITKKIEKQKLAELEKKQQTETESKAEKKLAFLSGISNKHTPQETTEQTVEQPQDKQIQTIPQKKTITAKQTIDNETKQIINEISVELNAERPIMLEELSLLWVSAVQKSDTVYFAIMKLSNPNGDEVNKNGFKKIMEPIIGAAPLVGQAFVNPAMTAGSLIGSNVLGTMMNDNASKRLSRVNDADLVILARAIDELQETLLVNYMAYKSALKEYELAIKITDERKKAYDELNQKNSPHIILANTFYTEALDRQYKARQEFLMKRVVLEQMVGADALNEIENKNTVKSANKQF